MSLVGRAKFYVQISRRCVYGQIKVEYDTLTAESSLRVSSV